MSDEAVLLAAARQRALGADDTVVRRRLAENARLLGLNDGVSIARLDDGDPIVARRLAQRMKLQLEAEARQVEPTDAELRAYLAEHAERFTVPERVRVQQVFVSVARRGSRAEIDARTLLNGLRDPLTTGDPSLWPAELPLQSAADLEKVFGAATASIASAPLHTWTGPHRSALGYHLTRVVERIPAAAPSLETVRAAVRLSWLNQRAERHVRQTLAAWR